MNSLIKHSKKIILAILLFALVITANFGLINATISKVYATEVQGFKGFDNQVDVSISNGNFSSNSSTADGYPYTPSKWTYESSKTSDSVKHGLVNLSETTYKNNYKDYGLEEKENPGLLKKSSDNYALMINSRKEASSSGYISDPFTFNKNGIYHVTVNLYTDDIDGSASLYLFNDDEVIASITNINAHGDWSYTPYHFIVETKEYENLDLKLGLWQGSRENKSSSCVMFDEINAGQISRKTLNDLLKGTGLNGIDKTNYQNIAYLALQSDNKLDNTDLVISNTNYKVLEEESSNLANSSYSIYYIDDNSNEIKIENKQDNKICFESNEYELISNKVYKFSVLAKTENLTKGNAFFKAVEVVDENAKNASVSISSTTNALNDNYTEYSIVIVSDPLKNRTIKFQLGLGATDNLAKGKVSFIGLDVSSVPYALFEESNSNATTIDFGEDYDLSTLDNMVENFAFFNSKAEEVSLDNQIAINSPKDWTVKKSDLGNTQKAGVFNVKDFDSLIKTDLKNFVNPGFITSINNESNNVLMLYNAMEDYLTCSSKSFSLTKESYYKVSVWVNTEDYEGANISLSKESDSSIVLARIDDIKTDGVWKEYTFYVKTGYEDIDASLNLALGSKNSKVKGYAYFDNCFVTSSDETAFSNAENKFDMSKPLDYSDNNKPTYFEGKSNNSVNTTSYLLNIEDLSKVLVTEDAKNAKDTFKGENGNVLAIHSTNTDDYYTLTSKLNYSLTANSYYKISVDVYTDYIQTNAEEGKAGASLKLTDLEDSEFVEVINKTDKTTGKSVWQTYTFYICPDQDVTTSLVLGLGNSTTASHGTVLFGNIDFAKIETQEEFNLLTSKEDDYAKVVGTVTVEEEEEEESEEKADINYTLLIYTLTAVAVIIAVVGIGFKKLMKPGKKRVKTSAVEYDRDNSVIRQKYRKLAYIKRDKDIRKLDKELELLHEDRLGKEEKYKQLLSKVRELKLANRDGKLNAELNSINKNLTKASKDVAKIGVLINKINNEIAFMKTEGYLQSLEKKLMKQDEYAKSKGTNIESIIMAEDENVTIDSDTSLDEAISKADKIIEDKKQEAILEEERKAKEELERLEAERLEAEKAELARLEAERIEQEKQELQKAEEKTEAEEIKSEDNNQNSSEENAEVDKKIEENSISESETVGTNQEVENNQNEAEKHEFEQNSTDSEENSNE